MKNIKETTISVFAMIGLIATITGFTNEKTTYSNQCSIPESYAWSIQMSVDGANRVYSINAITGEVREINKANYKTLNKGN